MVFSGNLFKEYDNNMAYIKHILYVRHYAKCFTNAISLNPQNKPVKVVLSLSLLQMGNKAETVRLNNLFKDSRQCHGP